MMLPVVGLGCWHAESAFRESLRASEAPGFSGASPNLHRAVQGTVAISAKKQGAPKRVLLILVPEVGLEPTRYCYQWILSPSRLPFHHTGISNECYYIINPRKNQDVFIADLLQNRTLRAIFRVTAFSSSPGASRALLPLCILKNILPNTRSFLKLIDYT